MKKAISTLITVSGLLFASASLAAAVQMDVFLSNGTGSQWDSVATNITNGGGKQQNTPGIAPGSGGVLVLNEFYYTYGWVLGIGAPTEFRQQITLTNRDNPAQSCTVEFGGRFEMGGLNTAGYQYKAFYINDQQGGGGFVLASAGNTVSKTFDDILHTRTTSNGSVTCSVASFQIIPHGYDDNDKGIIHIEIKPKA